MSHGFSAPLLLPDKRNPGCKEETTPYRRLRTDQRPVLLRVVRRLPVEFWHTPTDLIVAPLKMVLI
jgi:hypothetical protein